MSGDWGREMGILSLEGSSKPTLGGTQGRTVALCTGPSPPVTLPECWMQNGWAVCSAGPSGPQKKQEGIYMGAVEATKANFPFQAWGRKKGGWSDSLGCGGGGGCWQAALGLWLSAEQSVGLQSPPGEAHKLTLEMDRCLEVQ